MNKNGRTKKYGYVRASTKEQNEDRQIQAMINTNTKRTIF